MILTPHWTGVASVSPVRFLESVGRMAIDFGLAGFVEKVEEHWGKWAGRAITLVAGLAIIAVGLGAIGEFIVSPILGLVRSSTWQSTLLYFVLTVFAIGVGCGVGLYLSTAFRHWRRSRQERRWYREARETVARVEELLTTAEATQARTSAFSDELSTGFRDIMARAYAALEESRQMYREGAQFMRFALEENTSLSDSERAERLASIDHLEATLDEVERDQRETREERERALREGRTRFDETS